MNKRANSMHKCEEFVVGFGQPSVIPFGFWSDFDVLWPICGAVEHLSNIDKTTYVFFC